MAIFIALGANLPGPAGPPRATLEAALARLAAEGVTIVRRSRWYRSAAWPDPSEPAYVNAVAAVETRLDAAALLRLMHKIEAELGRVRTVRNAPRTIDLDLLDYHGDIAGGGEGPALPHPRLHERAFVLLPLAEVAPDWRHPVSRRGIADIIAALPSDAKADIVA